MKKYSKIIALLTVAIFVLGFAGLASAATFSDIADDAAKSDIVKLNALGIINGYADGTFKPDGKITRAEFAKIAVVTAGLESSADLLKDADPAFTDVKVGAWYTGWINLAASQGYVKGYPNGTFAPNAEISNSEVVTVLLRILGYNDNLPGTWPVDYIVKAADLDITEDVAFSAKAAAKRGDVAVMAAAALDADWVKYDKDNDEFDPQDESLLAKKFESSIQSDFVEYVSYNSDGDVKVQFFNKVDLNKDGDNTDADDKNTFTVDEDAVFEGAATWEGLSGSYVDFILNDDNDIVFASTDTSEFSIVTDDEITIYSNDELKIDGKEYDVAKKIFYYDSTKGTFPTGTVNGTVYTDDVFKVTLNDDNDVVYVKRTLMNLWSPVAEVVDETEVDDEDFEITTDAGTYTIDTEDDVFVVVKNGQYAELSDLEKGDVVWVFSSDTKTIRNTDFYIVAMDNVVTGEVDRSKTGAIYIDGKKFNLDPNALYSTDNGDNYATFAIADLASKDLYDETVKVSLNPVGEAAVLVFDTDAMTSDKKFGVVVDQVYDYNGLDGLEDYIEIFVLDAKKIVRYQLTDDADYHDGSGYADYDPDTLDPYTDVAAVGGLVSFTLDADGEIEKIKNEGTSADGDGTTDANEDKDLIKVDLDMNASESFKWFKALSTGVYVEVANVTKTGLDAYIDKDDIKTISAADTIDAFDAQLTKDYVFKADDGEIEYMVIMEAASATADNAIYVSKGTNSDGTWVELVVAGTGTKIYDADVAISGTKGEVVEYKLASGDISDFNAKAVADYDDTVNSIANDGIEIEKADIFVYFDEDTEVLDKSDLDDIQAVTVDDISKNDDVEIWVGTDGIADLVVIK